MTDDLIVFLNARLDEDEAAAKACQSPSPWKAAEGEWDSWIVTDAAGEPLIYDEGTPSLLEAEHIARQDPVRILREVEAKRKIVEAYEWVVARKADGGGIENEPRFRDGQAVFAETAVRLLAAIYSDHPDYQQKWKP